MIKNSNKTAQVIIVHPETKKILGVSRKHDHNDFGLPGGRFEASDINPVFTIKRELKEETGIDREIKLFELVQKVDRDGILHYTYITNYNNDNISTREPHVVKWVDAQDLVDGSFGEFNKSILTTLGLYTEEV